MTAPYRWRHRKVVRTGRCLKTLSELGPYRRCRRGLGTFSSGPAISWCSLVWPCQSCGYFRMRTAFVYNCNDGSGELGIGGILILRVVRCARRRSLFLLRCLLLYCLMVVTEKRMAQNRRNGKYSSPLTTTKACTCTSPVMLVVVEAWRDDEKWRSKLRRDRKSIWNSR